LLKNKEKNSITQERMHEKNINWKGQKIKIIKYYGGHHETNDDKATVKTKKG
jgi:hypothetical protein